MKCVTRKINKAEKFERKSKIKISPPVMLALVQVKGKRNRNKTAAGRQVSSEETSKVQNQKKKRIKEMERC